MTRASDERLWLRPEGAQGEARQRGGEAMRLKDRDYWNRLWAKDGTPFERNEPQRPFWMSEDEVKRIARRQADRALVLRTKPLFGVLAIRLRSLARRAA